MLSWNPQPPDLIEWRGNDAYKGSQSRRIPDSYEVFVGISAVRQLKKHVMLSIGCWFGQLPDNLKNCAVGWENVFAEVVFNCRGQEGLHCETQGLLERDGGWWLAP